VPSSREGGEETEYRTLAEAYAALEATTKRLEMRDIMVALFKATPPELMDRVVYLTQGALGPDYEGLRLGLGEKLVARAVALTSGLAEGKVEALMREEGDLGLAAERALGESGRRQANLFQEPLTVPRVFDGLLQISRAEGAGSTERRIRILQQLLMDADPLSARFIVRNAVGKLRLGIADMTMLEALEKAFLWGEGEQRVMGAEKAVEEAYNIHPDLGAIALAVAKDGPKGIEAFTHVQVGVPIQMMLAERLGSVEEILAKMGGRAAFEYKYDGMRIQAHAGKAGVLLFSRRLEPITGQFPDVVALLGTTLAGREAILEFEAVVHNPETGELLPFQEVSHRRGRVHGVEQSVEDYPLILFAFDLLRLDGREVMREPFEARREALEGLLASADPNRLRPSTLAWVATAKEGDDFFLAALAAGCEGIIAKSAGEGSHYRAGARGWQWIKYKREYRSEMTDTVDLAVVGAYAGSGKRTGFYGALLMACRNPDEGTWESVCKLGTGFKDEDLKVLHGRLAPLVLKHPPKGLVSGLEPDFYIEPGVVLEVLGAEVTLSPVHRCAFGRVRRGAGLAIRFPRMVRVREDKGPAEATTTAEIEAMYRRQLKKAE
jgi:DNA ligase-1